MFFHLRAGGRRGSCQPPLSLLEEPERAAVLRAGAVLRYGGAVGAGGIGLVDIPAIHGVLLMQAQHQGVTVSFCQHRGGGYGGIQGVAVHYAGVGDAQGVRGKAVAVDEQVIGPDLKPADSALHAGDRCLQDVYAVYLLSLHHHHTPGYRLALYDGAEQVALFAGELLGVAQQGVGKVGRQNHSGTAHWAGQASTPRFVKPGFYATGVQAGVQRGVHRSRLMM